MASVAWASRWVADAERSFNAPAMPASFLKRSANTFRLLGAIMLRPHLLAAALSFVIVGCSAQKALVSGTVRFKGQPLSSGTVLFHGADGRVEYSLISEDGNYTIAHAPIGIVCV